MSVWTALVAGAMLAGIPVPAGPAEPQAGAARTVEALNESFRSDPGFKPAYRAALGPLASNAWLANIEGPGDTSIVTVLGVRYFQVTVCKQHDCGDNKMVVLYRPAPRTLYGIVRLKGGAPSLIGAPPAAMAVQLRKRFVEIWGN